MNKKPLQICPHPPESANQSALLLAAIVESSDDAIISKDLMGVITSWNKSAERILGYTAEEAIGQSITIIIPEELRDEEFRILAKIRSGAKIHHFQTVRVAKNGERLDVSLTASPVKDQDGRIVGAAKILRDITAQKQIEAALHVSERLASVGRLAATVAHEINNPLAAVTNFIYLAKQQRDLSEKTQRYLQAADQELMRATHIAQQILGFYREDFQPEPLIISELIENLLSVYESKLKYKTVDVDRRIAPDLKVCTFEGELKQILSNLISNAIDASRQDGKIVIKARVSQHFRSRSRGIRITVADNGSGIPNEHKRNLFTPFFTTKKEVGTGLGLWITRELLEKRGGHIQFRSSDSGRSGTVMRIYLPLASTDDLPREKA